MNSEIGFGRVPEVIGGLVQVVDLPVAPNNPVFERQVVRCDLRREQAAIDLELGLRINRNTERRQNAERDRRQSLETSRDDARRSPRARLRRYARNRVGANLELTTSRVARRNL